MSPAPLYHHVFSSDGGYRTTYASPELTPEASQTIESFASAAQRAYSHGVAYSCFGLGDGLLVPSCTFVHGADHVGRRRLCTHSVVLTEAVLHSEGFNPAAPPVEVFMTEEVPAEHPAPFLKHEWPLLSVEELADERHAALDALDDHNAELLAALLSPARTAVLAGPASEAHARLAAVAWLLPPEVRSSLMYRSGSWPPEELEAFGNVAAVVVPETSKLAPYSDGQFIHVDLGRSMVNVSDEDDEFAAEEASDHPYVGLLQEMQYSENGYERLVTLLRVLNEFPGPPQPSLDQQTCLARAYRIAEPALLELERTAAVSEHAPEMITAISPVARSGRVALAENFLGILQRGISTTDRQTAKRAYRAVNRVLQEDFFLQGLELGDRMESYGKSLGRAATTGQPQG